MSCWKGMIGIPEEPEVPKVVKVCEDIKQKDSTFKYKVVRPFGSQDIKEKFAKILVITSDTEEDINKRCGWFIHKMKDAKVADYFWTKVCNKK